MSLSTEEFREVYRHKMVGRHYHGLVHLLITHTLGLFVLSLAFWHIQDLQGWEVMLVPLFFLIGNLAEYFGHKKPMHQHIPPFGKVFKRHSLEHHRFFTHHAPFLDGHKDLHIVLFPPLLIVFFLGLMALPLAWFISLLISPNAGLLFIICSFVHFLLYEWLHLYYHLPPQSRTTAILSRLPFLPFLREHHRLHHNPQIMREKNLNLTLPLTDALLGTLERTPSPRDKSDS